MPRKPTLHPISVADHILVGYRNYLRADIPAPDPTLRRTLEDALNRPLNLSHDPSFENVARGTKQIAKVKAHTMEDQANET